ncbi:MAG: glycosyltransferase [Prevotellaceae bacterium]|nr:glycosyltransferase [Candidatus Minthosoma caballi]
MQRVLFISQYLNRNGTEAFMMSVFRGIDHSRFAVDFLLYCQQESDYTREVEAAGSRIFRVASRRESVVRWHKELNSFFSQHAHEYHAIHFCGNSLTSIAPIYYAWKYKVPVRIIHAHNSSCRGVHNKGLHLLKRTVASRMATHHFACSTLAAKWFFGNRAAEIIKNGIEVANFTFDKAVREKMRTELGVEASTKLIGHVGRFVAEKNHDKLIDIFAEFAKRNPDTKLMLIGKGDLEARISEKCSMLGIEDKVFMLGERQDVPQLMQAMDLFLMPSLFEGLPYVLIEAQAAGLPCVISDVVNHDISLTPNVTYLSLNDDAEHWASVLESTLALFDRTAETAELVIKAGYSIDNTIKHLEKIY